MKTTNLMILGIFCFTILVFICGCTEQNNNNGTDEVKITMSAKEHFNDMETIQGSDNITINYKSVDDGDKLAIQDIIFKINYDYIYNKTIVLFVWDEGNESDSMFFEFEGDITDSFFIDDQVKITVKIKHVIFSYQDVIHDMELYEEQWINAEYFNTNRYKPLPASSITKI